MPVSGAMKRGYMPYLIKGSSKNVPSNILTLAIMEQIELARRYKMTYCEVIGVLELVKQSIVDEAKEQAE